MRWNKRLADSGQTGPHSVWIGKRNLISGKNHFLLVCIMHITAQQQLFKISRIIWHEHVIYTKDGWAARFVAPVRIGDVTVRWQTLEYSYLRCAFRRRSLAWNCKNKQIKGKKPLWRQNKWHLFECSHTVWFSQH